MKLLIVGGTGAFGSFYAALFKKHGFEVFILSNDPDKGRSFCEKNGYFFVEKNDIKRMDFVVISSPNIVAPKNIMEFAPKMKKGALLMDFCSVKQGVCGALSEFKSSGIELLSVHPMHGPRVSSIDSQQVVFIPIKSGKKTKIIEDFFNKEGANIICSTCDEHDEMLSIVQGLTHFSQFVSANVLREIGVDIKRSTDFGSPNYALFLDLLSRVVLQNPGLYAQIQLANPKNELVREVFVRNAQKLAKICREKNLELLTKELINDTQCFKEPELFLLESDRVVDSTKSFKTILKDHVGHKFLVENLINHKFHYGVIKQIKNYDLFLEENKQIIKLNLKRIRLTSKQEMADWRKKHIGLKYLDYSFLVDESVLASSVRIAISSVKLYDFELIDEFKGAKIPIGKKSLTFRATFFADDEKEKIDSSIKELIKGLGFELR